VNPLELSSSPILGRNIPSGGALDRDPTYLVQRRRDPRPLVPLDLAATLAALTPLL
jgi:hypothetical protein